MPVLGFKGRWGWLAVSWLLGAMAIAVTVIVDANVSDCSECYPGLLIIPGYVVLALLLGVGSAIGTAWRAVANRRSRKAMS